MSLKERAEALGIKVDGRWSDERIQKEIEAIEADDKSSAEAIEVAPAPATQQRSQTVRCPIARDYWDQDGIRHVAGTEVEVSVEAAFDGIETGALTRVR